MRTARDPLREQYYHDILVVAAGGFWHLRTLLEIDEDEWDAITDLNLKSVYLTCHAAIPHMLDRGWGRIIVSSWLARGAPVNAALHYVASKSGLIGFTRQLARELAGDRRAVASHAPTPSLVGASSIDLTLDIVDRMAGAVRQARAEMGAGDEDALVRRALDITGWPQQAVMPLTRITIRAHLAAS